MCLYLLYHLLMRRHRSCHDRHPALTLDTPYSRQSIGGRPRNKSHSCACVNGCEVTNLCCGPGPRASGEGCAVSMTQCRDPSISAPACWANLPHSMKTTGVARSFRCCMMSPASADQPRLLWLFALPASTLKVTLSSNIPERAHRVRLPWVGGAMPRSVSRLVNMVRRDAGIRCSGLATENARPCASPGVG